VTLGLGICLTDTTLESMNNFDHQLKNLDISLYEKINSQLEVKDKSSLLACQLATRELRSNYRYLEIGSYLGGSIQPHLLDSKCSKIFSIDKRPESQPDERGVDYTYLNNSTQRMLDFLGEIAPDNIDKITTFDIDTRETPEVKIDERMDICFVDGEHTDEAAWADFKFCLRYLKDDGTIIFHDAPTVYNGIAKCVEYLEERSIKFRAYALPAIVFVIEIGDFPIHKHSAILERLTNSHESYLYSLQYNDYYRQFANKSPFRFYRKVITKMKGLNKFD